MIIFPIMNDLKKGKSVFQQEGKTTFQHRGKIICLLKTKQGGMIIFGLLKNGKTVYRSDGKYPYHTSGKCPYHSDGKST